MMDGSVVMVERISSQEARLLGEEPDAVPSPPPVPRTKPAPPPHVLEGVLASIAGRAAHAGGEGANITALRRQVTRWRWLAGSMAAALALRQAVRAVAGQPGARFVVAQPPLGTHLRRHGYDCSDTLHGCACAGSRCRRCAAPSVEAAVDAPKEMVWTPPTPGFAIDRTAERKEASQ